MDAPKSDDEEEWPPELATPSKYYENDLCVKGPPFIPAEYMISPSVTSVLSKEPVVIARKRLSPSDLKFEPDPFDPRKALHKLKLLLRDKFGRNQVSRQKNLVGYIVKGMPDGFYMEDLASVSEITEFFALNYKTVPEYVNLVTMILEVAVHLPKVAKSSDILNFKKDLSDYFTVLGELLAAFEDDCVQSKVLEILMSLLVRQKLEDLSCVKLQHCHSAMEESLLPYTVACILETVCQQYYCRYLETTLQIVNASKKSCIVMIESGAMEYILRRLDPQSCIREKDTPVNIAKDSHSNSGSDTNIYYKILSLTGQLLWEFLNTVEVYNLTCNVPSRDALRSLRQALQTETKKGNKNAILARNNFAGIASKLLVVFGENLPFVQSGLAVDMALFAVATEIGTKNTWAENISFGSSRADFMLKKMAMLCCCEMAKNENMFMILKEQKVVEGFLHLTSLIQSSYIVGWTPSQYLYLLGLSLSILSELVPVLPEVYVANKGSTRLLKALEWFMEEYLDKYPLIEILKTLCAIVNCKNNQIIIQDLKKQHGVKTLLNICFYILESPSMVRDHQANLARIFTILELLCKKDVEVEACIGKMYVGVSIKLLKRVLANREEDSKFDQRLLICFSGFFWETVAWCPKLLKDFTEEKGLYLLLDLIVISSYPVQIMFLGLLVDVASERESLTHLLTWRDKNGYGILNTLINIWKKEELLNKVPRSQSGCIADVERPLMTEEQWYMTHCVKNAHIFSPAIAEMMCNARPKIHSLYKNFMQNYGEDTRLNESLYSINFSLVQPENRVYIPLIDHFLVLKMGEVWYEIYNDVIRSGLLPPACEGEALATLLEEKNKWAYHLKKTQEEIVTLQKLNASDSEMKLYRLIRTCCLAPSLDAMHELDYIAKTSYKDVQICKKGYQLREIDPSLNQNMEIDEGHVHRTAVRDTNVTYLCGKYVWFKSEREVLPQRSLVEPVSPNTSDCDKICDF